MEVKGLKEVKGVKQLLSKIITGNDFFDKVFTDAYDGNIFFESWNIFNFETYSLFLKLLIETNEKKAYLVPKNFLNYSIKEYQLFLKGKEFVNEKFVRSYELSKDVSFDSIDSIQEFGFYESINSYIISESGKWCFYVNTSIDLMILGFKEESLESINDVYKGSNDLLNSINDIFELCKNAYRSEDINKNYSTLMDNYKKTLKTI